MRKITFTSGVRSNIDMYTHSVLNSNESISAEDQSCIINEEVKRNSK